jgi:adenosine kinase
VSSLLNPAVLCLLQVITQGKEPTIVAKGGVTSMHAVPAVDPSLIVDTNGAGDAFVGGFLAAFIKGKDTAACCAAGCFAASVIIQTSGTALPKICAYEL